MSKLPGVAGADDRVRATPQLYMDIDRTKVKSMGISLTDVNQTLQSIWARPTSTISTRSAAIGR